MPEPVAMNDGETDSSEDPGQEFTDEENFIDGMSDISGEHDVILADEPQFEIPELRERSAQVRDAFRQFDFQDIPRIFSNRACVMKSVPKFLKGPYRVAMRVALVEATSVIAAERSKGRKLFVLLPRMLLSRRPRGGLVSREQLRQRFDMFAAGQWEELIRASEASALEASVAMHRRRRRRNVEDDSERRAARAQMFVELGEVSAGRAALEAAAVAPGDNTTLESLRDPRRRPDRARDAIPARVLEHVPAIPFSLDEEKFAKNVRSARKGVAPGPSGMTCEHLRSLLENPRDLHILFLMAEQLARGEAPDVAVHVTRLGRIPALQKPAGGVRGIVASDVIRRLVARTMAQQLSERVKSATAPFQYALSTRCISHALQAICDSEPNATVVSIDGIGAFDLISRRSMLQGLFEVAPEAVPFCRQYYGSPSSYIWQDEHGVSHTIVQGEGGEQGDPLMPMLFALGVHAALCAIQSHLQADERVFAYLDDIFLVTTPARVGVLFGVVEAELWRCSRIRVHQGKTQVWNRSGVRPPFCDVLDRAAVVAERDPTSTAWRGDGPTQTQGIRVLGTPLGHDDFVRSFFQRTAEKHATLLERIPTVSDVQSPWALLLHWANARANYSIRVVRPELCGAFAEAHDSGLWRCLCAILRIPTDQCDAVAQEAATLPLALGGLGLRSAARTRVAAHWASWADSLPMIRERHHVVAAHIVECLTGGSDVASLASVIDAASDLREFHGFDPPSWSDLANGARPPPRDPEDFEPKTGMAARSCITG